MVNLKFFLVLFFVLNTTRTHIHIPLNIGNLILRKP